MARTIVDCAICARLPQKSSEERLPKGAAVLVDAPAGMKRCPECDTFYSYSYDHDPGEPMVPATDTYTLIRLTPMLARACLRDAPADQKAGAQFWLDAFARDWTMLHETLADASAARLGSAHTVKHIVESLTDYYLENNDRAAFLRTLLGSPRPAVRANAATDILFVATEEHPVWNVRAFSRHQQTLAAAWLPDAGLMQAVLEALVGCLDADDETVGIDATLGNRAEHVCDVAYHGLANAIYRKLVPMPVMSTLHALAEGPPGRARDRAALLVDVWASK
jgi:hypothetical protein